MELSRSDSPESGTRFIEPILVDHLSPKMGSECGWGLIGSGVATVREIFADEEALEVRDEVVTGTEIVRVSE